jgi:cytoskeletal protein CcmA (bactofilin family)
MFKKKGTEPDSSVPDQADRKPLEDPSQTTGRKPMEGKMERGRVNTILKGSRLTGDINVSCDLELSGDVEGNITSNEESHISIKGTCKGNIDGGNVNIEGELLAGNITAGKDVRISGKFKGGEIKANGRIHVDGEFKGKLEANEIEIGSNARGEGELLYREFISIAKGARLEAKISQMKQELTLVKDASGKVPLEMKPLEKETKDAKASNKP